MLLVNDDPASLFALETLLAGPARDKQYELITASSGHEALRHVLTHEFAVILLDVNMPGMDGFETADAIHSHPRSAAVPIIFITAHYADEMHRLQAYQKGAVDYLFTPVIPQILQTKVAVFVALTRNNLELVAKTDELSTLYQDLRVQRLQDLERINAELELEVAERKLAEARAHELSVRDALTGLVNRRSLIQQLEHAVAHAERHHSEFALLFLDLDRFKRINDLLGHDAGDELLRQVAARLLAAVRASDVVARLGGDEFVVLLEGAGASANAALVARKIEQANAEPFDVGGQKVRTSSSIGIGLYPQDGATAAIVLRNADTAMYHAKQHRRGSIEYFREELNAREVEHARWAQELQLALDNGELELHYQPRADVRTRALAGVEALLYWRHRREGLLAAADFMPRVADRKLLEQVGDWAIGAACAQAALWRKAALPQLAMSVNLAALQIQPTLPERVAAHLDKCGIEGGWLELEIAEHLLVGADDVKPALNALRAAGVRLAVDDFGSAGASLTTLRDLPFDTLKIDCAFVRAIGPDAGDDRGADMVAAIIHLARALGLSVVALGVANSQQLAVLDALGCDQFQGALLGEPAPPSALPAMLLAAIQNTPIPRAGNPIRPPFPPPRTEDNVDE
ncbi:MAG: EAL domain-containing protein [Pseudomonadota bacterium]